MKKFLLISLCLLPLLAMAQEPIVGKYKKALIIGAHPDDPESMCGGTMLMLQQQGCEVVSVYLTAGEAGIPGKTHEEAAAIRREECKKACEVLGMRYIFMTQIDGSTEINKARYAEMKALIEAEQPDIVITHWPIDSHRDHRICSILVYDAWRQTGRHFDLYYGEVMTGLQTQNFTPDTYVNITPVRAKKIEAYLCHNSQGLEDNVAHYHDTMEEMRGLEFQCKYAEAFVKQRWNASGIMDR